MRILQRNLNLPHRVRNVKKKNVLLFEFRCNIYIGVRIIKEMPGTVASGTPCITRGHVDIHSMKIKSNIL